MNCSIHPERSASGTCAICGEFFCRECLVDINGRHYCKNHASLAFNTGLNQNAQPNIIINNSLPSQENYKSKKSKAVALILCLFFGMVGAHRFYAGKVGTGLLWLCTGSMCGIGWLYDIIKILTGTFKDGNGLPLT